jgi:hypothetical protein
MSENTTRPSLKSSFLTVYPGYAQVEATFEVALNAGANKVLLDGMPTTLIQKTTKVWDVQGAYVQSNQQGAKPATLGLIEFTQPNLTADQMQRRRLNGKVIVYSGGVAKEDQSRVRGVLLQLQGNTALLAVKEGSVQEVRNVQGIIYEDGVPAGLSNTPSLAIDLTVPAAGTYILKVLYLAKGFQWEPEYMWTLDEQAGTLVLDGSVLITNGSGATFNNSGLSVASGDAGVEENDSAPAMEAARSMPRALSKSALGGHAVQEASVEELGTCKFYDVPGTFTVSEATAKATLALISGIPFTSEYRVEEPSVWFCDESQQLEQSVSRSIVVENNDRINKPLPGGAVTLLQVDKAGHPRRTGKGRLKDFAVGATQKVETGEDIDLKVTRKVTHIDEKELEKIQPKRKDDQLKRRVAYTYSIEVELFNGKDKDLTIILPEFTDKKRVKLSAKHPFTEVLADKHEAAIVVAARTTGKVNYQITVTVLEVVGSNE